MDKSLRKQIKKKREKAKRLVHLRNGKWEIPPQNLKLIQLKVTLFENLGEIYNQNNKTQKK